MAGSNYVLDKGFPVLSTYNSSNANGVTAFRVVKCIAATGTIDLAVAATATALQVGVVQENIDRAKVATGKAVADVRLLGITKVVVDGTPGTINHGTRVMCGAAGGVIAAATAASYLVGIAVGVPSGTAVAGDIIDVLLTPGAQFA